MAYTSIIPVSRLDNSITYIRNKDKTTKKGQSAGSLEEAIDYAMNRDKTERSVFEDAIGCRVLQKGKSPRNWHTRSAWSWQKGSFRENTKQSSPPI